MTSLPIYPSNSKILTSGERRPRIALVSPGVSERPGVTNYVVACSMELGRLVDLHVFTQPENQTKIVNASVSSISHLPYVSSDFDRVITVIGNNVGYDQVFSLMLRYGGACIFRDSQLLEFYEERVNRARVIEIAEEELSRLLTEEEVDQWSQGKKRLEATFLSELTSVADPLFVHSLKTAELINERFESNPVYLPIPIQYAWRNEMIGKSQKLAARRHLGITTDDIVISTFGSAKSYKSVEECIWTIDVLHGWGILAHLYFVGSFEYYLSDVNDLINTLNLGRFVHIFERSPDEKIYKDYLIASDIAIQIDLRGVGTFSEELLDCLAAGLPVVSNKGQSSFGENVSYLCTVPENISPVLLAEAIESTLTTYSSESVERERQAFIKNHSFKNYAENICEQLGLSGHVK